MKRDLVSYVARELDAIYTKDETSSTKVDGAIEAAFVALDNEIVHGSVERLLKNPSKAAAPEALLPALSGSCALLAFFDSATNELKVAVTGDSRAIYGKRFGTGWSIESLSVDQTGSTPAEVARLQSEHPGEQDVVRNGRILGGLEPSRAFGDARYKWASHLQQ